MLQLAGLEGILPLGTEKVPKTRMLWTRNLLIQSAVTPARRSMLLQLALSPLALVQVPRHERPGGAAAG